MHIVVYGLYNLYTTMYILLFVYARQSLLLLHQRQAKLKTAKFLVWVRCPNIVCIFTFIYSL